MNGVKYHGLSLFAWNVSCHIPYHKWAELKTILKIILIEWKKNDIDYYYDNSESHMSDSCKDKKQSNAGIKRTAANSLFPIVKICLN